MTNQGNAEHRAAIDAPMPGVFRFAQSPLLEKRTHAQTGIVLHRIFNCGPVGTETYADRVADGPDFLFLSRGGGRTAHGHMAGARFERAANTDLRATFTPQGADSCITFGASAKSTNLIFPRGFLADRLVGQPHGSLAPLLFSDDDRLARLVRLLEAEIVTPGFASQLLVDGITRAIATLLVRLDPAAIAAGTERIHLASWKLRRVIDYIEANIDHDIGLVDIAKIADLSPFHFSRVFKLATGQTPYGFVMDKRLKRSRALLAESNIPLAELALACGFANQSHFTAAFTKATGVAPGRFRRQMKA
jgi:AraC-like DNA-binding protein